MGSSSNHSKLLDSDGVVVENGEGSDEGLPAPHLANAITVKWFAADLTNSTAVAAVHEEVRGPTMLQNNNRQQACSATVMFAAMPPCESVGSVLC